jgi:ABC-type bacteriocin/lantibiotic exporter with double-glycine peptidase domain
MRASSLLLIVVLVAAPVATAVAQIAPPGELPFTCGLDAAYIFLNRAGHHAPYEEVVADFQAQAAPDSLLAIKNVLQSRGCRTLGVKATPDYFLSHGGPAIIFVQLTGYSPRKENHFSYAVAFSRQEGVELLDPAFDLTTPCRISWDSFVRIYQGTALIPDE